MNSRMVALMVVSAAVLVAAGCGGSGDDTASSAAPKAALTKAEFIKRADKICEQVDEIQKKAYRNFLSDYPDAEVGQALREDLVLEVGLPPIRSQVKLLDELPVPQGDEKEIKAIVEGMEEAVETAEEVPNLLVNLQSGAGPFTKVGKLAREYGFKACSLPL